MLRAAVAFAFIGTLNLQNRCQRFKRISSRQQRNTLLGNTFDSKEDTIVWKTWILMAMSQSYSEEGVEHKNDFRIA